MGLVMLQGGRACRDLRKFAVGHVAGGSIMWSLVRRLVMLQG